MINAKLLQDTLVHIKEHPEQHDQRHWGVMTACGTTFCFAGTALLLAGYTPVWGDTEDGEILLWGWIPPEGESYEEASWLDGTVGTTAKTANTELGISAVSASQLFYMCKTVEDLEDAVANILRNPEESSA